MTPFAAGLQPFSTRQLSDELEKLGANVIGEIKPRSSSGMAMFGVAAAGPRTPDIIIAELDQDKGEELQKNAPPGVIVEHDALLKHADATFELLRASIESSLLPTSATDSALVRLRVAGADDTPVKNATVFVYGRGFPAQGTTDRQGKVELNVLGGGLDSIQAVYVKPEADYWEKFITRPSLSANSENTITLRCLSDGIQGFPASKTVGWGGKMMGLDRLSPTLTGRGAKVAIIDSGCDNTHPQLNHVVRGHDFTTDEGSDTTWNTDVISHGTHCAGVIGGGSSQGIRGFAPDAEVFALKVFPGGRFSSLIDALDLCIEREIDVVNLSLGSDEASELVAHKILEAKSKGVACIVAAGNSAGPVQFPGSLLDVLTVSAIGRVGEFPDDTYHAQTVDPQSPPVNGIFTAKFSCFGPQVDVCAPGVAIISCVPGGYAAWDGTSMATPHVTGLATLLLAHHPLFQGPFKQRNAARVEQLFQLMKSTAVALSADFQRTGSGIPTLQTLGASDAAAGPKADTVPDKGVQGGPPGAPPGGQTVGIPPWLLAALSAQQPIQSPFGPGYANQAAMIQLLAQLRSVGLV
jgi:subtilisin family serine protease